MLEFALRLARWIHDCDGDGFVNDASLCLRGFSDLPGLVGCLEFAGPHETGGIQCNPFDWAADGDVDMHDVAKWMNRFQPAP